MSEGDQALGLCRDLARDDRVRGARIMWLGIILVIGAVMPVIAGRQGVAFINFELLGERGVPGMAKFMALYPLLAGIAVIVLGVVAMGIGRSIALCAMGLLPVIVLLADRDIGRAVSRISRQGSGIGGQFVISLLGSAGILIGSRILRYRWRSRIGGIVGTVGAGLTLISLFVPFDARGIGRGLMAVTLPFKVFETAPVMGAGLLIQMACIITAAALCIVSLVNRDASRTLGGWILSLWVWAAVAAIVGVIGQSLGTFRHVNGEQVVMILVAVVKFSCWIGGILLLVPVGVTDLIVNLVPAGADGSSGDSGSAMERLTALKGLLAEGLITQEDYEAKKNEIMSSM